MKSVRKVTFPVRLLADVWLIGLNVQFILSFTAEPKSQMSHTEDVLSFVYGAEYV